MMERYLALAYINMHFYKNRIILFLCTWIIAASSCAYKQQQVLFEKRTIAVDSAGQLPAAYSSYHIQAQDVLQIRNLQNRKYIVDEPVTSVSAPANTNSQGQTYEVQEDGTVTLPVIGHVTVAGLTRLEAAKRIEDLYRKELKDPIIELKIINLKVSLFGEVKNQGNYPLLKDNTSLVEVIGEAGGLTERANSKNVKIIRGNTRQRQIIEVDLSDIKTLTDPRIILQNNDIVTIAQNNQAIRNDKLQNVSSILSPAIVLLNDAGNRQATAATKEITEPGDRLFQNR
jgi:polysaccharide export outer membrane protein